MLDEILKAHLELEEVNNDIIAKQNEVIKLLQEQNQFLRKLVEKYVVKEPKL